MPGSRDEFKLLMVSQLRPSDRLLKGAECIPDCQLVSPLDTPDRSGVGS